MQDFVFFIGRFHVLALHLPIGIVIAAVALDWAARRPRYAALADENARAKSPALVGSVQPERCFALQFTDSETEHS